MASVNNATAVDAFLASYNAKLNSVGPRAVLIQLGLMIAVSAFTLLMFSILRPNNSIVYQPKIKYATDDKLPPIISRGFFSWIKPSTQTTEDSLMRTIGLDGVCFLRFLRMCRNLFTIVSVVACAGLFPIDIIYNLNNVPGAERNFFSILTIQSVYGNWLYGHVAVAYFTTAIVFYFCWTNYRVMVALRWQYFRSDEYQNSLHARSVLITSINKPSRTDAGLADLLASLSIPYPTTAVKIGRRVGKLPELLKSHNDAVRTLESTLHRLLTSQAKKEKKGTGTAKRPTMKVDGTKVDAIEHLSNTIHALDAQIELARSSIDNEKAENYGFASFASVPFAHIVGKALENRPASKTSGAHFVPAPQPADLIWSNLNMSDAKRSRSRFFGNVMLVLATAAYVIPLGGVALLANMAAFTTFFPWLESWYIKQQFWFSAFVGVVPPLLSALLMLLLPMMMRAIALYQGDITHSQSDRVVTARYSAFLFITQFFIFNVLTVIISLFVKIAAEIGGKESFATILKNFDSVPRSFQAAWVIQSMFWLNVIPLRGFSFVFDLAQVISLLYVWVQTILFGRTPRDIREFAKPPEFDYAVYFSGHLLMVAVALVYAPLAPLVSVFTAIAFSVSAVVYQYQLMYISSNAVETGGRFWRVAINRILFAVVGMQALMLLTLGLQLGWYYSIAMVPALISVVVFKVVLSRQFDSAFRWYIPSEPELSSSRIHRPSTSARDVDRRNNQLGDRFGHPSLHEKPFPIMLTRSLASRLSSVFPGQLEFIQSEVHKPRQDHVDSSASSFAHGGKSKSDFLNPVGKFLTRGKEARREAREEATIGGLRFLLVGDNDTVLDRAEYLQERDPNAGYDGRGNESMATTPMMLGSKAGTLNGDDYFTARGGRGMQDGEGDVYELSRMATNASTPYFASTEQLIPSKMAEYRDEKDRGLEMNGRNSPSSQSYSQAQLQQMVTPPRRSSNISSSLLASNPSMMPSYSPSPSQSQQIDSFDFGFGGVTSDNADRSRASGEEQYQAQQYASPPAHRQSSPRPQQSPPWQQQQHSQYPQQQQQQQQAQQAQSYSNHSQYHSPPSSGRGVGASYRPSPPRESAESTSRSFSPQQGQQQYQRAPSPFSQDGQQWNESRGNGGSAGGARRGSEDSRTTMNSYPGQSQYPAGMGGGRDERHDGERH